jgi:OTU domain-containing protein 6
LDYLQDKKVQKEKEKELQKQELLQEAQLVKSPRQIEMEALLIQLKSSQLQIKEILSDGNCLYRAIADQLQLLSLNTAISVIPGLTHQKLREIAANHLRTHSEEFAPFVGLDMADPAFEEYCQKVASETLGEWGGQIELRALSEALEKKMIIYAANAPPVIMGEQYDNSAIIQLSFHQHYYALGEHYNSVVAASDISS